MGGTNKLLADSASRFFNAWQELIVSHLKEAQEMGSLSLDADCEGLALLMMSSLEGALVIIKASRDKRQLQKIGHTIIQMISRWRV